MSGIEKNDIDKNDRFYYANSEADEKSKSIAERGDVASSFSLPLQRSQIPPDEGYDPDGVSNPDEMSNSDEEFDQGTKDFLRLFNLLKVIFVSFVSVFVVIMLIQIIIVILIYIYLIIFDPSQAKIVINEALSNLKSV